MPSPEFNREQKIKEAQKHLRANKSKEEWDLDEDKVKALAQEFQNHSSFSYARRLFQLLHKQFPRDEKITEKLAVCTYKDTDLSSDVKYDAAAKLLITNFETDGKISDANILGVLGSIFKKKWKYNNHTGHLYQSLNYYLEGYRVAESKKGEHRKVSDIGYCGINLAFVYDLLARLETFKMKKNEVGYTSKFQSDPFENQYEKYKRQARKYREKICEIYDKEYSQLLRKWKKDKAHQQDFEKYEHYWYFVTWAEALLGLGKFDESCEKFAKALQYEKDPEWMKASTRLQCYELIELLYGDDDDELEKAKGAMVELLEEGRTPANQNVKIGLALSGGGFRASIFHIGVLAKLAEADLLRKVEVISCVSGGSILGAYYYLKLKELLEGSPNEKLGKQDYIDLVIDLEKEFLDKVNKNVRLHILTHLGKNMEMAFSGKYTRSSRTAELYDKYLYNDYGKGSRVFMDNLKIFPNGDKNFRPDQHNWKMENKVPVLVLNATALNTGHSWQFTATWMGESPAYIGSEFDALPNLRRMYYSEAPEGFQKIPLSTAVTASAGVPGLFAPIKFEKLYEKETTVLLVDGGVHDNQGISTLYEQECNMLIISDASGQMPEDKKPAEGEIGVFQRTNSILQERIRFSQFRDLESRKQSGLIRDFILMHLTKGLPTEVLNWEPCEDPYVPPISTESEDDGTSVLTDYLIREKIQTLLARIRTDLDAFHESESSALMYSGYKMTEHEIKMASSSILNAKKALSSEGACSGCWNFMKIDQVHENIHLSEKLEAKLIPSSSLIGKTFKLSKKIKPIGIGLITAIAVAFGLYLLPDEKVFQKITLPLVVLVALGTAFFLERKISKWLRVTSIAACLILLFPLGILLWLVFLVASSFSTKWYLSLGKLPEKQP